jgi:hypothetical protein
MSHPDGDDCRVVELGSPTLPAYPALSDHEHDGHNRPVADEAAPLQTLLAIKFNSHVLTDDSP